MNQVIKLKKTSGGYESVKDNTPTPTQCKASDAPKWEGIKVGSVWNGSSWEYTANSNPGPCQWTYDEAYEKKWNEWVSSSYSKCWTVVKILV